MEMNRKNRKGILLTLVTIVLILLMLAELITYVYITIGSQTASAFGTVSSGGYELGREIQGGSAAFLHSSLYSAIRGLAYYEGSGTIAGRKPINNTAYALQSLMMNGTVYGSNSAISVMGDANAVVFTNAIIRQADLGGFNLSITNLSIQVYQTGPFVVNATLTALVVINSSSGKFTYPIATTSGIELNGSPDLYAFQRGMNYSIKTTYTNPAAVFVGNTYATSNSNMAANDFIYGTIVTTSSNVCPSVQNEGYDILVASNNIGTCGFGGFVTNSTGTECSTYGNVPCLVYNSNFIMFRYIKNGTKLLLSGSGLALINTSELNSAMHEGYYYNSSFSPSYLDWSQNNASKRSQDGQYSFNLYNLQVPIFSSTGIESISTGTQIPGGSLSMSLWANLNNPVSGYSGNIVTVGSFGLGISSGSIYVSSPCGTVSSSSLSGSIGAYSWHNIVAVYNSSAAVISIFLDGSQIASGNVLNSCASSSGVTIGGTSSFSSSIANLQVYNTTLSNYSIAKLYYGGIEGMEQAPGNLIGWWPLDGNANDISGYGNNGSVVLSSPDSAQYRYIYGYVGDPVYGGSLYNVSSANVVEGVLNCANPSQCCDHSLQHLYLYNASLSLSNSNGHQSTEAASLGVENALIPYC